MLLILYSRYAIHLLKNLILAKIEVEDFSLHLHNIGKNKFQLHLLDR